MRRRKNYIQREISLLLLICERLGRVSLVRITNSLLCQWWQGEVRIGSGNVPFTLFSNRGKRGLYSTLGLTHVDCPCKYLPLGDIPSNQSCFSCQVVTDGGSYVPMPTGFPKFEPTGMRNKRLIFRIPKFNNTVIIDPSVNVGPPDKGQPGGAGHNNAASSLQFFFFALFLSIFIAQYW